MELVRLGYSFSIIQTCWEKFCADLNAFTVVFCSIHNLKVLIAQSQPLHSMTGRWSNGNNGGIGSGNGSNGGNRLAVDASINLIGMKADRTAEAHRESWTHWERRLADPLNKRKKPQRCMF